MATVSSASKNDFKTLLEEWGLKKYISKFEDDGYDDPKEWEDFCEDDDGIKLEEEELMIEKGDRKRFVKKWRETFVAKKEDEKDEEKNNGNPKREIFPDGINIVPFEKQEYKLSDDGKGFLANQVSILRTQRDKIYSLGGKQDVEPGTNSRMEKSKCEPEKLLCSREHKIILVCGKTGVGKSTLINSMINYIYDVQYGDKFRLRLIEENKSTQHISSYTIKKPQGGNINYDLTIIDTPGFGYSVKKDKKIVTEFQYILDNVLTEINGICFVVKSTDNRLDASQTYVFNSILNLWAKDISKNIFILMTFADGKKANCIDALDANDILKNVKKRFKINNSAFTDDPLDENFDNTGMLDKYYWDMGRKCLKMFFDELDNIKPQSTEKSKEVSKQRDTIQANSLNDVSQKHKVTKVVVALVVIGVVLISMINYIYDVQYGDKFGLRLIEENKSTQHVSSYTIKKPKGGNINYDLTIIDTPGFGYSKCIEKDKQTVEEFKYILDNEINGICFAVKSTDTRLDESQANVFNSTINLWSKDISKEQQAEEVNRPTRVNEATSPATKKKAKKYVLNCQICSKSCLVDVGCMGFHPYLCNVMDWGGKCTNCGCGSDKHVIEKYEWKRVTKEEKISNVDDDEDSQRLLTIKLGP